MNAITASIGHARGGSTVAMTQLAATNVAKKHYTLTI